MTHSFVPVVPGNLIHAQDLNQVINALDGLAAAGVPIVLTALSDPSNFALVVQNQESSNSRALLVLKSDGTQLVRVDVNGVTLGAPLNLTAQSVNGTALLNASVPNAALGPDVARANLLTNGGFEIWQRGTIFNVNGVYTADRWSLGINGTDTLAVQKSTGTSSDGSSTSASMYCNYTQGSGNASAVLQFIRASDTSGPFGKTVSVSMRIMTTVANMVRLGIDTDGTGAIHVKSAYHNGNGQWQTFTLTSLVPPDATYIAVSGNFDTHSGIGYLDNACLVVGSQPANYVPLHPADDLARCLRYYEVVGASVDGSTIYTGWGSAASAAWYVYQPYQGVKAVTPTLTKNGTWIVQNCGQPSLLAAGVSGFRVILSSTAANGFYAQNAGAGQTFTIEANP